MTEQQRYMYESTCKHCDKRIVLIPFALGDKWVHQEMNRSFVEGTYEFCKVTRAEAVNE